MCLIFVHLKFNFSSYFFLFSRSYSSSQYAVFKRSLPIQLGSVVFDIPTYNRTILFRRSPHRTRSSLSLADEFQIYLIKSHYAAYLLDFIIFTMNNSSFCLNQYFFVSYSLFLHKNYDNISLSNFNKPSRVSSKFQNPNTNKITRCIIVKHL